MTGNDGESKGRAKRYAVTALCLLGAGSLLAGCNSDDGSGTPNTRPTTTTISQPKVRGLVAKLMITGDRNAVIQGNEGTCTIPRFGAPKYELSGDDYPTLGPDGFMEVEGPISVGGDTVPASAKVVITDVGFITPRDGSGITFRRDNLLVTLDAPLAGGLYGGEDTGTDPPTNDLQARVTGTIRCTSTKS